MYVCMFVYQVQVRRLKEKDVIEETSGEEVFLDMEEDLTNAQDGVCNNIRDVVARCDILYLYMYIVLISYCTYITVLYHN